MPKKSKKQIACSNNINIRYTRREEFIEVTPSFEDHPMSIEPSFETDDLYDFSGIIYRPTQKNQGCQYEPQFDRKNVSTQTLAIGSSKVLSSISKNFKWANVSDLLCVLVDKIPNWSSIHFRIVSVIVYLIIRLLGMSFESTRLILKILNLLNIQNCHEWVNTIIDEDDLCVILRETRGAYKRTLFYEFFPELEKDAKAFILSKCTSKESSFDAQALAKFVDERFREICPENDLSPDELVRSIESCRVDLLKWRARWDKNTNRPYFEGHERDDVVLERKNFIQKMHDAKDFYYYPIIDESGKYKWLAPMRKKRILISHDESIFRSGEMSAYRWILIDNPPFFNKGKGRSIMISIFMVQSDSGDLFELSEEEYSDALKENPQLSLSDADINYYPRSANAWIEPKKDNYFDNQSILKQFERLFILAKYKKSFKDHEIDVIVDNARTHTSKVYDIRLFNKFPGTNCIYKELKWIEFGEEKM